MAGAAAALLRAVLLSAMLPCIMLPCIMLGADPALAQDAGGDGGSAGDGAAAKGDAAAADAHPDVEPVAPRHGSGSLWRRANVKTLVANAAGKPAGAAAVSPRTAALPRADVSSPRNAIGMMLPGGRPLHQNTASQNATSQHTAGRSPAGGTIPGPAAVTNNAGHVTHQAPAPLNAAAIRHDAAIDGRAMGRMATNPGFIGGPAADRSGINGTLMRSRR